ncbi:MAG: hypothetical protein IPN34_09325 [Planctomycetes bacterium]|nr:hypothetical protein [Planctomycetota bacterium]
MLTLEPPSRALIELGAELVDDARRVEPVPRTGVPPPRRLAEVLVLVFPVPAPSDDPPPTWERLAKGSRRWGARTPPKRGVTGRSAAVLPRPLLPPMLEPDPEPSEEPELVELPKRPPDGSAPTPEDDLPAAPLGWPTLPPRDAEEEPRPLLLRPT